MTSQKRSVISWAVLIILTLISVYIGEVLANKYLFLFVVLAIVLLKGQQIVDIFMELSHAPRKWRWILLSYISLIPLVIFIIYSV